MTEVLQYVIYGLGISAVYGLLGQGIIVIYKGAGVVNFAQGSLALVGAWVYVEASGPLGAYGALVAAAVAGMVLAILIQNLALRPLRNAAPLSRIIATLGVLITVQAAAFLKFGSTPVPVENFLPTHPWHVGHVVLPSDRLILLVICVAVTVALAVIQRRLLVGLATRASAENDVAAAALGWSPNRLATISWATGGLMAGAAGALIVPIVGLLPETLTLLVVPALAAALVGRFDSVSLTLVGALGLGISQSLLQRYWTQTGVIDAVPFLVVIAILVITGRGLPVRGHVSDRLPQLGDGRIRPIISIVVSVVGGYLLYEQFRASWVDAVTVSLSVAVVLLSVVVITGYAGQLSLAQYAMAGLGAYVSGRLVSAMHWPFALAALVGIIAAIPMGLIFAVPALRTRGVNLAVVSLGMGVAVQSVLFNNISFTGGLNGTTVGETNFLGLDINALTHAQRYGVFCLVAFVLCAVIVANLRRSRPGRRLIAIRENERAAASLGVSVIGSKLYAFSLASSIAAVGGILIAFRQVSIVYSDFDPLQSINSAAFAVVGGLGFVLGPIAGSILADGGAGSLFQNLIPGLDKWLPVIGGVAVIWTLLGNQNGLIPGIRDQVRALMRRVLPARLRGTRVNRLQARVRIPDLTASMDVPPSDPKVFEIDALTVRYGGVTAVDSVSITIQPGEIVGLIGPNGAGKTSVIDAVSGYTRASGSIRLGGRDIAHLRANQRVLAGLTRSWQSLELFEDVSVFENLQVASEAGTWRWWHGFTKLFKPGRPTLDATTWAAVAEFKLQDSLFDMPGNLSYSQRRLVAIARAVALNPSVLLLDEPAAGLSSLESAELGKLLVRLASKSGMGILLVEHDVELVMSICDRVHVLEFGREVANGAPAEVRANPEVIRAYLGVATDEEVAEVVETSDVPAEDAIVRLGK